MTDRKCEQMETRWMVLYGDYSGIQAFAVNELQRALQRYLPYTLEVRHVDETADNDYADCNIIMVGTKADNREVNNFFELRHLRLPAHQQGYVIASDISPWNEKRKVLVVAGVTSCGVSYGVQELIGILSTARNMPPDLLYETIKESHINRLRSFTITNYPRIENRGIWTWGYVIYDYRRFIENMARLRFNTITIWNDFPPVNCREVIEYAHLHGIKVYLGLSAGWRPGCPESDEISCDEIIDRVTSDIARQYQHLGMDGLYVQTLTEKYCTNYKNSSLTAKICELANKLASRLLPLLPSIQLQFGIHATSILDNFTELGSMDPRITIVWEDAGVLPYSYNPQVEDFDMTKHPHPPCGIDTFEKTLEYSKKLATLRKGMEFAIVPKGWTCLNWDNFDHHKSFILGWRDHRDIKQLKLQRQSRWDMVNALWLKNFPYAVRFYNEILSATNSPISVTGLIEDGLLEASIEPSVRIFAETIWNPLRAHEEILETAMLS